MAQKKPEDKNFDGDKPFPPHIETDIWPSMDAGQPLHDMAEAEALEQQLLGSGLNKPVFPAHVWDVSIGSWSVRGNLGVDIYAFFLLSRQSKLK